MKSAFAVCIALATLSIESRAATLDFEDLVFPPGTYWKGPDPLGVDQPTPWGTTERIGSFTSRGASFNNVHDLTYGTWGGWAYSNTTDVTTPGIINGIVVNESSAYDPHQLADGGGDGSANYGVAFGAFPGDSVITLPPGTRPTSMRVTNTTYPALIMLNGDASGFAKKFGDDKSTTGIIETNFPDWFLLKVIGWDAANQATGSVDFYLADYRTDNDYVIDAWTSINLAPLGNAAKITFALSSSDVGTFGMNTPGYFALDNLEVQPVPEPTAIFLAAIATCGLIAAVRRR